MIRINEIKDALLHLVGWEQGYAPENIISEELLQTESGITFQGAHPLMTLDNIKAIMPEGYEMRYAEWQTEKPYKTGDRVRFNGKVWKCTTDNISSEPTAESEDWEVFNALSDYVEELTRNGIATMVQKFITEKQLNQETRNLLERRTMFDGAGRLKATTDNRHKIVGLEINPVRSMGVTTKIERIGLQMTGGTGRVRLYLFHSSMVEPYKTIDVEITKGNGSFEWFAVKDCYLPYIGTDTASGGSWYLCYNQDELPSGMQAINVSKDWSREPCGTCNVGSIEAWRELTKYLQVSPFMESAPTTFAEHPLLWDIADMMYTNTHNYGMNMEVSVGCDLTDFIISQRQLFATALQLQVTANALRTLAMNPNARVNRNQSNASRMDILYELDGNTQGREAGIGADMKRAYEALKIETRGIDRICLSCNNHGVRYRTV